MATLTDKELDVVTTTYYSDNKDYKQFAEWLGITWEHYHAIIKAKLALSETTEDDENISK